MALFWYKNGRVSDPPPPEELCEERNKGPFFSGLAHQNGRSFLESSHNTMVNFDLSAPPQAGENAKEDRHEKEESHTSLATPKTPFSHTSLESY